MSKQVTQLPQEEQPLPKVVVGKPAAAEVEEAEAYDDHAWMDYLAGLEAERRANADL